MAIASDRFELERYADGERLELGEVMLSGIRVKERKVGSGLEQRCRATRLALFVRLFQSEKRPRRFFLNSSLLTPHS